MEEIQKRGKVVKSSFNTSLLSWS